MEYISVTEFAGKHGIPERTARNYCAAGKIDGAILVGKTWSIPADAEPPARKKREIKALLKEYNVKKKKSFDDVLDLHQRFEAIHPFQEGNGRVGRLVMFKECLANGFVPFIITDELKMFYYRGLRQWPAIREYLRDTCLTAQDNYKALLDYYRIKY